MPALQSLIAGIPTSTDDPWLWNVDQVVYALTQIRSPLLQSNESLSMPNPALLASVLQDNDVNGLALLTLIKDKTLRDEFGIKSMSHRASIMHLIRLLRDQSQKYEEQFVASSKLSSFGEGSRVGSPFVGSPQQNVPKTAPKVPRIFHSPVHLGGQLQTAAGIDSALASTHEWVAQEPQDIVAEAPGSSQASRPVLQLSRSAQDDCHLESSLIDSHANNGSNSEEANTREGLSATACKASEASLLITSQVTLPERSFRQGETIIIDETGRERRRLILSSPVGVEAAKTQEKFSSALEELRDSPNIASIHPEAVTSAQAGSLYYVDTSIPDDNEALISNHKPPSAAQIEPPEIVAQLPVSEPGTVLIDNQGKKRLRPISLSQPDLDIQNPRDWDPQQRTYGRKSKRKPGQLYAGFEPMNVDKVFYGDNGLETKLEHNWLQDELSQEVPTTGLENFTILPRDAFSNGQRLYVNARMKYFLRSPRLLLERDGREHIGIVPYPDHLGRKHSPLSVTIFSKSSGGVTASRSNRSKWLKDYSAPNSTAPSDNIFNVADPAHARTDGEDPEWRALEKWKYVDADDKLLPLYGDSGSEGEYELDNWREIEQESGTIARPLGRSEAQKLTGEDVHKAIESVMKQLIQNWANRRLPKLERKAWRFWTRSRRDKSADIQIRLLTAETEKLDVRIKNLRKGIADEVWSNKSQLNKQCTMIQPSIFDREDNKWRIALLRSTRAPAKPPLALRKPKVARAQESATALGDGEEDIGPNVDASESSTEDSLDDFIVEDDVEAENNEGILGDDDLSMAESCKNDSNDLVEELTDQPNPAALLAKDDHLEISAQNGSGHDSLIRQSSPSSKIGISLSMGQQHMDISHGQHELAASNFIDLTQQSDPIEPPTASVKPDPSFAIKTPPVFDSENDSEVFQRSRGKEPPVFRKPFTATNTAEIIDLDTETTDAGSQSPLESLPNLQDTHAIGAMDPSRLVARQDRKRLLTWMLAHTPKPRREAAFKYLENVSTEQSRIDVTMALQDLRGHKHRIRGKNKEVSDSIMQIAIWQVCWTIPVKVDLSGLRTRHLLDTLADKQGYEPFYDFLLGCMDNYRRAQVILKRPISTKKRERIIREDSEDSADAPDTPLRKRKYHVQESQATLDKRQAAQDRLRGDEERRRQEERRREELKHRFANLEKEEAESLGVLVNPGKLAHQESVYLSPRFGNGVRLRAHQREGLQFLWREIAAAAVAADAAGDATAEDDRQGCLLAQTMGLGKTMQIIALLVALSEASRSTNRNIVEQVPVHLRESRTLVLCPPALVENWWDEFILWLPQPSSENVGDVRKVTASLPMSERLDQIYTWSEDGGVLLIGYDAFKNFVNNKARAYGNAGLKKAPLDEIEHSKVKKVLINSAELVIADEAHYFKTMSTEVNLVINQIRTKSRIALTGSPLSNNLEEYYTLIDWVAPNYLGTRTEFKATYEEPIREGLYLDSTPYQKRTSLKKLKALEMELGPKVNRVSASVLQKDLKGKSEFVIEVPLTELQEKAYNIYVEVMRMASSGTEVGSATILTWLGVLQLLCNHPKCYWDKLQEPKVDKKKSKTTKFEQRLGFEEDAALPDEPQSQILQRSKRIFEELTQPLNALGLSNKMQILLDILRFADAAHDKVLVFSHRIATLDYIAEQLTTAFKTYVRIDGTLAANRRQQISKDFNTGNISVCLISTRAGGTGLNFYGANRVVILDENFNPTWEQQAVGRAYRIGQQKHVYVYRLQAAGTFEKCIQNQGLFKEQLATRVVDKKNPTRSATKGAGAYMFPPRVVNQEDLSGFLGKDPLILDNLLADPDSRILAITPSEIFHVEDGEELTPAEKREAEQMLQEEKLRRRNPMNYNIMVERKRMDNLNNVLQASQSHITAGTPQTPLLTSPPVGGHHNMADLNRSIQSSIFPSASQHNPPNATPSTTFTVIGSNAGSTTPTPTGPDLRMTPTSKADRSVSTPAPVRYTESGGAISTSLHTRSSSAGPSASDSSSSAVRPGNLKTRRLDRQLLLSNLTATASEAGDAEVLDALGDAVADLLRLTSETSDECRKNEEAIPTSIQATTQQDFWNIMLARGLMDPAVAVPEAARDLYAHELSQIISRRSTSEAEHHRLASGVSILLERDEVKPKHLVKVMMEKNRSAIVQPSKTHQINMSKGLTHAMGEKAQINGKTKKDRPQAKPPGGMLSYLGPSASATTKLSSHGSAGRARALQRRVDVLIPPVIPHKEDINNRKRKAKSDTKETSEGADPDQPQDNDRSKKRRSTRAVGPNFKYAKGQTEKNFQHLLEKEASRSSK